MNMTKNASLLETMMTKKDVKSKQEKKKKKKKKKKRRRRRRVPRRKESRVGSQERDEVERMPLEMEILMNEVFDAVSAMKRAYLSLKESYCPWDAKKMRVADVAVATELQQLAVLRERYCRSLIHHGGNGDGLNGRTGGGAELREVVVPYEASLEEMKKEVKAREVEVENLKEKLWSLSSVVSNGRKKRQVNSHSL